MTDTPAIIFTDLDGTLLDHHNYSYQAAQSALSEVRGMNIPLILTTSKTLAEVADLSHELENPHPFIIENGGILCIPPSYFPGPELGYLEQSEGYLLMPLSNTYREILDTVNQLRDQYGFQFSGFNDMTADEVATQTGLDLSHAALAKRRLASEPLLWQDSEAALRLFTNHIETAGLRLTKGGRFLHLMGHFSKALAMTRMIGLYQTLGSSNPTIIALGDSENDCEMLQAADISVVIKRHDGTFMGCKGGDKTLFTDKPGPAGWNDAVLTILNHLKPPQERLEHG